MLAITTANFPNLFRIGGAGTATGHISHILQIESGVRYAIGALRAMDAHGLSSVEVTEAAEHAYAARVGQMLSGTVFVTGGCTSWYLDKSGQASAAWPSTARRYRRWTRRFDIENYHLTSRAARPRADQAAPRTSHPTPAAAPAAAMAQIGTTS